MNQTPLICFVVAICFCQTVSLSKKDTVVVTARTGKSSREQLQAMSVQDLIKRVVGNERSSDFVVDVNFSLHGSQSFLVQLSTTSDGKLMISANGGIAAAWGFNYFLKYFCNSSVFWSGRNINLPNPLPKLSKTITLKNFDKWIYYQNVCTYGYSFSWWNWTQWEQHIDWMAMNGINFPLAFNGQEEMWRRTYFKLGLNQTDLDEYFAGPAFLAWNRMGNMRKWGGPLPASWYNNQVQLQHAILDRTRSLGMIPILPGFAGFVPQAIQKISPKVNMSWIGRGWGNLPDEYTGSYILSPTDPLFAAVGQGFYKELVAEYGTDHYYNMDPFNEMVPPWNTTTYLSTMFRTIFTTLTSVDPMATWVLQGWFLLNSGYTPDIAKAMLTAVPQGSLIVLDLESELAPQFPRLDSYFGQPFIWNMLQDFGGLDSFYGAIGKLNTGVDQGRVGTTMSGIGLTPEGIFQNEVVYEFMLEKTFRPTMTQPQIEQWITAFISRRYGSWKPQLQTGWSLLVNGILNSSSSQNEMHRNLLIQQPSLKLDASFWYDPAIVLEAWDNMVNVAGDLADVDLFRYDLVDTTRQCLGIVFAKTYAQLLASFNAKDVNGLRTYGGQALDILEDLDTVLAADRHFLLGSWLNDAKQQGANAAESDLLEFNARNQITLWGPTGNIQDYAHKHWAGLVAKYYRPRWQMFVDALTYSLQSGVPFSQADFQTQVFNDVEEPFNNNRDLFPTEPLGDSVPIVQFLHYKYQVRNRRPRQ